MTWKRTVMFFGSKTRRKNNMDHPNLSPEINAAIAESELQGGVFVDKLPLGHSLRVTTQNTKYTIERREDGLYMSGHYKYCPKPVKVNILGSNFGGSMLM